MNAKTEQTKWDRREVGALWTKLSKDKSQKYMTGHIQTHLEGKIDVVIFSNKDKKNDKAPDFRIYISDKSEKKDASTTASVAKAPAAAEVAVANDDDGVL
jgi:uncharacterized protein (DUF736 family)